MYFITAIISADSLERNHVPKWMRSRTFGYYPKWEDAHAAVTDNVGNMCESMYDFIVIEHIGQGIHALSTEEHWYAWTNTLNCWQPCQKPEEFQSVVNWALG
jgi:hypothetical protein